MGGKAYLTRLALVSFGYPEINNIGISYIMLCPEHLLARYLQALLLCLMLYRAGLHSNRPKSQH